MRDNPRGELDLAVDDRRRCNNSLSVFSCIEKRTKKAVNVAAKWDS